VRGIFGRAAGFCVDSEILMDCHNSRLTMGRCRANAGSTQLTISSR